jgi:hypothetical protein
VLRSAEQVVAEIMDINGAGLTKNGEPEMDALQLLALVTTTETDWPLVRVLVVNISEEPFCLLTPPTIKL